MSIIQHRDNVITLPIVADDNECRPIFSNNRTLLRGNDEYGVYMSIEIDCVRVNFTMFDRLWDQLSYELLYK